jgi:ADP-ribosyl-[dinitrogen reductase] hydrolase
MEMEYIPSVRAEILKQDRFRGCLLGGAAGDALGAPVEFLSLAEITHRFGEGGIREYSPAYGKVGAITDDTQMTLFTAEGLLRAWVRVCERGVGPSYVTVTKEAYLRWLETQGYPNRCRFPESRGWLVGHAALFNRRAPGSTCLSALRTIEDERAINNSKGCGGVMRVAPAGLFLPNAISSPRLQDWVGETLRLGSDIAAITHGHPSGYLAAGTFALLIGLISRGSDFHFALSAAKEELRTHDDHEETLRAIELAEDLATSECSGQQAIRKLGEGWVAEEALAIAIYCTLKSDNFESGIVAAVNHDGDSDSTGSIAGNLLGCLYGAASIPVKWLEPLELRDVIEEIADDLLTFPDWDVSGHRERYPPN